MKAKNNAGEVGELVFVTGRSVSSKRVSFFDLLGICT